MKDELAWGTQKNYFTTQRYVYEFLQWTYNKIPDNKLSNKSILI